LKNLTLPQNNVGLVLAESHSDDVHTSTYLW